MSEALKKSDLISVAPRFLRSVNLHSDWQSSSSADGYIVTPNVAQALEQLSISLDQNHGQRAFSINGPYGTGKSAFAVFMCQLLGRNSKKASKALQMLSKAYPGLYKRFSAFLATEQDAGGFLAIPVTARRRPLAQLLLEGIEQAALEAGFSSISEEVRQALRQRAWTDTAIVFRFLEQLQLKALQESYTGILLLVDEAGKTLEYALQDRAGGDVYIFQELAEYANRQHEISFLFLITLHQMFDEYVELSDKTLRNEWSKVQERFQSLQFSESAGTTIKLIASAITPEQKRPVRETKQLNTALKHLKKGDLPLPLGLDFDEFSELAYKSWPLHPSLLLAMPYLFRRLAQNERSIFSYITSWEPFAFRYHLEQPLDDEDQFIRLHHVYSYLLANFESGLARLPHAKRLLEANDIINSRQHLKQQELELVKTVALLNVLSEVSPIRATPETISMALAYPAEVTDALEQMTRRSLLTYRKLDKSYRIWEGSDVDIEARLHEAHRQLQFESASPLETLSQHLPERNLIARRHSLKTGISRYFKLMYSDKLNKSVLKHAEKRRDAAGTVMVLLPQANATRLKNKALEVSADNNRLIIALPTQIEVLRGIAEEVAALRWVEQHTPELRDDRIARRELSLRLAAGEQRIAQQLQTLLDPRPAPYGNACEWIWNGEDQQPSRPVDVTKLLSSACDAIYPKTPTVRNELVVRKKISGSASGARRILLERMLEHKDEVYFGIEGFPAERAINDSILLASGMHYHDEEQGCYDFRPPPHHNSCNLRPCWNLIDEEVFSGDMRRIPLTEMFGKLADVPYGLPGGVHPILFAAFFMCYKDELFLYREETFIPEVQAAHFELLQRRPDLFAVSGARLQGVRKAIVQRLASGLNEEAKTAAVVRKLYRVLNALPDVTKKTSRLPSDTALEVRDSLLSASSPEELLFTDLPKCLGMPAFYGEDERKDDVEAFFRRLNEALSVLNTYATKLLKEKRDVLLQQCGLQSGEQGWHELEQRAAWLSSRTKHEALTPFLNSVNTGIADNHNVRPALSMIARRPFVQWTDTDTAEFDGLARGIGELFGKTWQHYGSDEVSLTSKERRQKEAFQSMLKQQIETQHINGNRRALAAALRELLNEVEANTN